jgi:hypothetical protein
MHIFIHNSRLLVSSRNHSSRFLLQNAVATAVAHASGQQYCECVCPANDPWRCDCSGLVSRAWGLGSPGLTTCGARLNLHAPQHLLNARWLFQSWFSVIAAPPELLLQLRFQPRRVCPPWLAGRTAAGRRFAVARRPQSRHWSRCHVCEVDRRGQDLHRGRLSRVSLRALDGSRNSHPWLHALRVVLCDAI